MTTVELTAQYIVSHLTPQRPLFVAIQGPQGSGKSYITAELGKYLQAPPYSLRVVSLSIDDLYLPHEALVSLARANSENVLWQGRGQPGTHDVDLGVRVLSGLQKASDSIELPRFDKSLHSGAGDRLPIDGTGVIVRQPPTIDVVIFEGWCVGFRSISREDLLSRWNGVWKRERVRLSVQEEETGRLADIEAVNERLKDYERLWDFFDCFIKLSSESPGSEIQSKYSVVYKWRLQQEHHMKSVNGGRGMTDEDVKRFVDRYIPGYVFFGDMGLHKTEDLSSAVKKCFTLILDENRTVTRTIDSESQCDSPT
ncbi:hypothetical protein HYPSUDRAFT_34939 [Hypholoma sublateritium FD-334 SS-4]|uniref:Phosphoribulokinase/uridine kinase domain-containing protein n=1 Tax=Hypholoma sublateritium (strain FD-334 SS-4) TaxID=945553 RepID=A0A0D2PH14_HYPSF|nr:hypothetical protein HYPSUDRAFT_34939 [Hypholoma sublateritium FD-334 SS-4]